MAVYVRIAVQIQPCLHIYCAVKLHRWPWQRGVLHLPKPLRSREKTMAHPGRAGTGLWSCRREPARQSPPIRATIPCATASLAGKRKVPKGSALRPDASDFQGDRQARPYSSVAAFRFSFPARTPPIFWDPHSGTAGERWASFDGAGLLYRVKAPSPASIRCPWSDPSL